MNPISKKILKARIATLRILRLINRKKIVKQMKKIVKMKKLVTKAKNLIQKMTMKRQVIVQMMMKVKYQVNKVRVR